MTATDTRLMPEARHLILPDTIVASEFPAIEETCSTLGLLFDPWQSTAARCIVALDDEGQYAADTVVLSIARQVGKTFLVALIVFADSVIHPGTTTVWTAHRFKVARETFNELKGIAQLPALAAHIDADQITTAAGNECIPFLNGSRIMFAARERGSIRGFTKVRRLILDEAQILTETALADLAPTQNQAENPQIILMGTPPKPTDPGEAFSNFRTEALEGHSEGVLYLEISASDDCDLDDVEAWEEANPSLYKRTPLKAIRRLRKLLVTDDDFAREALGIWAAAGTGTVIDADTWDALRDPDSKRDGEVEFAVDVRPDYKSTSISVAGRRSDGLLHGELVEKRSGTTWAVDRLVELVEKWGGSVSLDPTAPAGSLIQALAERGIEARLVSGREMAQACGEFYDAVTDDTIQDDGRPGRLRHIGQRDLGAAVDAARKRLVGDAWAWHRRDTTADITPLVSLTLAAHAAQAKKPGKKRSGKAAFY